MYNQETLIKASFFKCYGEDTETQQVKWLAQFIMYAMDEVSKFIREKKKQFFLRGWVTIAAGRWKT